MRKARQTLAGRGKSLRVRCFFLEKDPVAYSKLKEFADSVSDAQLETRNTDLEGAIGDILKFVGQGGRGRVSVRLHRSDGVVWLRNDRNRSVASTQPR